VLIVDDQRVVLRIFALALERAGYQVQVAASADAALECIHANTPDVILIDLTMPYVNGMGLAYRVRKIAPQIPMAMITGAPTVTEETREELQTLGVALHFKPLTEPQIQAIVAGLLASAGI
jgi:two-component system response regulator GlrR